MPAKRDINGLRLGRKRKRGGTMSEVQRWMIGTGVAVVGLVIALLAWLFPRAPTSSQEAASASTVTPANTVKPKPVASKLPYTKLRAGDCLTGYMLGRDSDKSWANPFTAVSCSQAHTGEVFFADRAYWKSSSYPGESVIDDEAQAGCDNAFESYVGIPYHDSKYTWTDGVGTAQDWETGDHGLFCIAYYLTTDHPGGSTLHGSIKGSGR